MLQLAQRTSAPSAVSVSMSTAVWTVMCSEPVTRAPFSGCSAACSSRTDIRPGISCSASLISLRPNSARPRSATLKSLVFRAAVAVGGIRRFSFVGFSRWWSSSVGSGGGGVKQTLVLVLLPAEPVGGGDVLGAKGRLLEPALNRVAKVGVGAHSLGECHVREPAVETLEQLAQRAQPL